MGTVVIRRQSGATDALCKDSATPGDKTRQAERAARLRYTLASAGGSWGREFRLLLTLADERGVSLDTDTLAFYDIRDLQALQRHIVTVGASQSRWSAGS
jgi:hypothetical protein